MEETARLTDQKTELDEYEKEKINQSLTEILASREITRVRLTFFRPDKRKGGGAYVTVVGEIADVDTVARRITLVGGKEIPLDDVSELEKTERF